MCTGPHGSCPPRCKLPAGTPGWASGSWSESGPRSSVCLGRFLRSLKPSDTDYSALCFPQGKETKLRTLKSWGGKKHHLCGSALSSAPRVFFLTETVKAFKTLGVWVVRKRFETFSSTTLRKWFCASLRDEVCLPVRPPGPPHGLALITRKWKLACDRITEEEDSLFWNPMQSHPPLWQLCRPSCHWTILSPLGSLIPRLPTSSAELAKDCALSLSLLICKMAVLWGKGFGL